MSYTPQELTGYCGLYCGDCLRYNCKVSELASQLDEELEIIQFHKYAEVKKKSSKAFSTYASLQPMLHAISSINCKVPCRAGGDGCSTGCTIIRCVQAKELEGCWQCIDFRTCKQFDFLKPFHGEANIINLQMISEHGLDNWLPFREKCYPWED